MTSPVQSLDDFLPTYIARMRAGDATGVGALYTEDAVMTVLDIDMGIDGEHITLDDDVLSRFLGDRWAAGREQVVETVTAALETYEFLSEEWLDDDGERPDLATFVTRRGDDVATLSGRTVMTVSLRTKAATVRVVTDAFRVLVLSPTEGWQCLTDQSSRGSMSARLDPDRA